MKKSIFAMTFFSIIILFTFFVAHSHRNIDVGALQEVRDRIVYDDTAHYDIRSASDQKALNDWKKYEKHYLDSLESL